MLSAGIVGLPNVGKSTLFNAITRTRKAEVANYPFCTIEPNQGIVSVPDNRLEALSKLSKSTKIVPAAIELVDIAGLVSRANQGAGLGNQFLSHIREVDAIVQVIRCFESSDIHHVSGSVDPTRDIEVINTELILADLASVQKRLERSQKQARAGDKVAKAEAALLERLIPHLNQGKPAITLPINDDEKPLFRSFFLLSGKPTIFACNVEESDLAEIVAGQTKSIAAKHVTVVSDYVRTHLATEAVVISAQLESELIDFSADEAAKYLSEIGVTESGVGNLIRTVYHLLGLQTYFTTGEKETRAWTIHIGNKAPAAAGVIHSDFERGFIAVETVAFNDFITFGSFGKAREAGKLRIEGKEYIVKDGDIMEFRFNV